MTTSRDDVIAQLPTADTGHPQRTVIREDGELQLEEQHGKEDGRSVWTRKHNGGKILKRTSKKLRTARDDESLLFPCPATWTVTADLEGSSKAAAQ